MIKATFVFLSILLLSACSIQNPTKTKSPSAVSPTATSQEMVELSQEASSDSDKDVIKEFESDIDSDFSADFSSLEKDLE